MEIRNHQKADFFQLLKDKYQALLTTETFHVKPQMPLFQIEHFLDQVCQKNVMVTLQLNKNAYRKNLTEVRGKVYQSKHSQQFVLKEFGSNIVHLINMEEIRHLRLN